ncbi:uncharacterized protein BCR38DRAFT_422747 [Pseudomassariella vexata]|uniref:Uncharacterized protein n=1 Tax=Pseudomassariella vexata TaxID=1141098 RepID=A0A1Y2EA95_9PEZI|nr:uncharacterized protein BCR38DRAFT_422747 [Pseudomassariella vexata]ORY68317.1 hypothetical protein BCR38DRAFT_422747 [Pseudomassariella vexata]
MRCGLCGYDWIHSITLTNLFITAVMWSAAQRSLRVRCNAIHQPHPMAARSAITLVKATKTAPLGTLHIQCHVKPGVSKTREGIVAVLDDMVELCVSAQPRQGESNKAVLKIMSEALSIPKTNLQIVRGLKARDKTIAVTPPVSSATKQNHSSPEPQDWALIVRTRLLEQAADAA